MDETWGKIDVVLKDYMTKNGISKNSVVKKSGMQFTQFQGYYNNEVLRVDLFVLARICTVLGCDISDVLTFRPSGKL